MREFFNTPPHDVAWYKGQGCSHCNHTGYSGRVAVAELWTPSQKDMILVNKGAGIEELRESSSESTIFMAEDAMDKLRQGSTNLEELIRTLPFSNINHFRNLFNSYADQGAA
jgi:type II secretory ATPase GspE/PulE/Tfp pilus assembly ATPase PilB-like protein